jgi:hypothetical protein
MLQVSSKTLGRDTDWIRIPQSLDPVRNPDSVKCPDPDSDNLDPKRPNNHGSRISKAVLDNSGTAPERFEGGGNPIRHRKRGGVEGGRGFLGAASDTHFPAQRRNCDAG